MSQFDTRRGRICLMRKSEAERFWNKVDKSADCWEWTAYKLNGYGRFGIGGAPKNGGRIVYAHRWAWESENGPIPEGLSIDHLCMNKGCVNPDHLESVTTEENSQRWAATITHCPQGHEYSLENTLTKRDRGRESRLCRECNRLRCLARSRSLGVVPVYERPTCGQGHPWSEENTYINPKGKRQCRTCVREAQARYKERQKMKRSI